MDRTNENPDGSPSYLVYEFERRAYPLSAGTFTIGRDATSDIVVREPSVSRSHVEIAAAGGDFTLTSTGATGTLLNSQPVTTPATLVDGDTIGVGSMEFTFRRGRLPLGVSVVDTVSAGGHDPDAMTRRSTITNPILGSAPTQPAQRRGNPLPTLLLFLVLIAVAGWYFFGR